MKANRGGPHERILIVDVIPETNEINLKTAFEDDGRPMLEAPWMVLGREDALALSEALRAAAMSRVPATFGEQARRVALMIDR